MKGLTVCLCLTIIALLSNNAGSCILIEGLSERNNSVIIIDPIQYCQMCPENGLCPYFTELVRTQLARGLMDDDVSHFQEKGFLTISLHLRNFILLLRIRRRFHGQPAAMTTGPNMSEPTSGSKRGKIPSSKPTFLPSMSLFQEQSHRAKSTDTPHKCVQRGRATYVLLRGEVYQYQANRRRFQAVGFNIPKRWRPAVFDVLSSTFYLADRKGIKRACVDGRDVHSVMTFSSRRTVDDISIDSHKGLLFHTYERSHQSKLCFFDMSSKKTETLISTTDEIIMSIDTEKQILYYTNFRKNIYSLMYGGDKRERKQAYKELKTMGRLHCFTVVPDKNIIACGRHVVVIMNLESKNTKKVHLKRYECDDVQVTDHQIHMVSDRFHIFTMTGKLLDVMKYPRNLVAHVHLIRSI